MYEKTKLAQIYFGEIYYIHANSGKIKNNKPY